MAKKVLDLQYGIGPTFLTGHITRLGRASYRAFLEDNWKVVARRDLDHEQFRRLSDELSDYCEANPEYEFESIWPFQDFVLHGEYPKERGERLHREREIAEEHGLLDD